MLKLPAKISSLISLAAKTLGVFAASQHQAVLAYKQQLDPQTQPQVCILGTIFPADEVFITNVSEYHTLSIQ